MAKQGKSKKIDNNNNNNNGGGGGGVIGKGKITPVQVAFIVDRYLADNHFPLTRTAFRSEASSLISKSSLHEAPKSLLSLGELLDEYIELKGEKVMIEHEKLGLAQERARIQSLLQGMHDLMTAFNSSSSSSPPPPPLQPPLLPPASSVPNSSSAGYPAYRNPIMTSVSMTQSVKIDNTNYSTPIIGSRLPRKRKNYKDLQDIPQAPKKYCGPVTTTTSYYNGTDSLAQPSTTSNGHEVRHPCPALLSSSPTFAQGGSPIQGSSVAKNLFDKPSTSPNSNSSCPKTPPRPLSSQSDKSISPLEGVSSTAKSHSDNTPPETTPTNCTIFSSKTIIVSPAKRISIERSHCTFSSPAKANKWQSKREHVKGRLDFDSSDMPTNAENTSADGSSTSESEKEGDIFDLDLPNFDAFGPDFSLTDFLSDCGIDCATLGYSCPTAGTSPDEAPESLHEGNNRESWTNHNLIEQSSNVRDVIAGDMLKDTESITSVRSIRKCVRILSPNKYPSNNSLPDQENVTTGS